MMTIKLINFSELNRKNMNPLSPYPVSVIF